MIALILKTDYEAITIKDICAAADVGRSTFYAHYTSKDDLKRSGLDHLRRQLGARQKSVAASENTAAPLGFSLAMIEHARDHQDIYRALAGGRGGALALDSIRQIVADLVRGEPGLPASVPPADRVPREFVVQYVVGAYMAVLTWWLDGGAKLSPQLIDAMFRRLATEGIVRPA